MGLKEDFYELPPSKCLLGGFLLCVVYYFLLFDKGTQFTNDIQKLQKDIAEKTVKLEEVEKAVSDTRAFEQGVASLQKDFVELLKYFPLSMDMNDIQKEMTEVLNKSGVKVVSLKETAVQNRFPGYIENGIELESIADFHQIMTFLADITKIDKVVDFRAMDFISDGSNDETSRIKFKMEFSVFAQDPNAQKKADDPNKPPGGK